MSMETVLISEFITAIKNIVKTETKKVLEVMDRPLSRIYIVSDIATTTNKAFNKNDPALVIENIDGASLIKEFSFSPDANFKTKGLMKILVDEVEIYELKSVEVFQIISIQTIKIPKGLEIKRNAKIKILLTSSDGSEVKMAVTITFADA